MTLTQAVDDLFGETGRAHHQAFSDVGGADPEWPLWYANYLQTTLNELLGTQLTQSEIVYHLVRLNRQYVALASAEPWSLYYATHLVEELGSS